MFFDLDKLRARITELDTYRIITVRNIDSFYSKQDDAGGNGSYPPEDYPKDSKMVLLDRWQGRDNYIWLSQTVQLPPKKEGKKLVGVFNLGKTAEGNSAGFESLLFVNQSPYHGVDDNHKEIIFPESMESQEVRLDFRLWSGLEGGGPHQIQDHQLKEAKIGYLNCETDQLYWRLQASYETLLLKGDNDPNKQKLSRIVNRTLQLIDWRMAGSDIFYGSIAKANHYLEENLKMIKETSPITVSAVGHTHIDVAWLWQLKHTREKSARSFSSVLALMDEYPEYQFLQTQPQLYKYLKTDYPEIYDRIKEKVKSGQWEVGGGMWLEADCNIPSGESLVRQLLFGYHFLKDEFDVESKYLWLPDVFGYSWALPQILKKSGIETFMTTKISWSQYNRMPHDTFMWRGIDGTEILTHFITTPDSGDWWYYTYNGEMSAKAVMGMWENYRNKAINQDLLLAYGYGDGGGGVNRDMLETRRALNELPGLPNVEQARADDYFERLIETVKDTDQYVHTWDGELYLEYHRGTYTSQAFVKRKNRELELKLKYIEFLKTYEALEENSFTSYPQDLLNEAWEIVLRNQFHDTIPGTAIAEVYEDVRIEYAQADALINETLSTDVAENENSYTIYNDASYTRAGLICVEDTESDWVDANGTYLDKQLTSEGTLVYVPEVPALGTTTIIKQITRKVEEIHPFTFENNVLTTPYYTITFNDTGEITQIVDIENKRNVLKENEHANVLRVFEDKPIRYDAWDIDMFYQEKQYSVELNQPLKSDVIGPLVVVLSVSYKYQNSTISQEIKCYRDSRRIDFVTNVEWKEHQQLLKVAFPVNVRSTEATYEIQFGNVKRPTHWNTSWDYARFETVGHKWADLSEGNYGVALLNDSKYGYDIKDHVMRLSLIKSGIHPDPDADQGHHEFTYALLPHKDDWFTGNVDKESYDLNQPLIVNQKQAPIIRSLVELSTNRIVVDSVKKAEKENAMIIRLHEQTGSHLSAEMILNFPVGKWIETDLMERPIAEWGRGSQIEMEIAPYEIKTYMVYCKDV